MRAALEQVIVRRKWDPRRLGPVALWIDPSDTTTMFQSNAGTTTVTDTSVCGYAGDKSGNVFHLTSAADDTTRPTWVNNASLPYVNIASASSQKLRKTSSLGMYAAGAISIFAAVRGNPATGSVFVGEANTGNATQRYQFRANSTTATTESWLLRNDANTIIINDGNADQVNAFDNTDRVVGYIDSGTSMTPYVDGVAGTGFSYTRSGTLTIDSFCLGARFDNSPFNNFWNGRVYGLVIVKRAITASEIASLTTYLGAKQGRVL